LNEYKISKEQDFIFPMETTLPAQIFRLTFFTTEILITSAASASIADYDYVTSIKVNDVDLASPLPA